MRLIQIHPDDNVAVALENIPQGETIRLSGITIRAADNISRGHKIALKKITSGEAVVKYGNPIGIAKKEIPPGAWVHIHNVRTGLRETTNYTY
ncbi:MAG: UxaA family hydrolase, partial [Oscillospiraceae bacterium]|nr:UxaA family hydrolase [Oscillospiraceae bacterium]